MKRALLFLYSIAIWFNSFAQNSAINSSISNSSMSGIAISELPELSFPGISRILIPGMSRSQFMDVCAIQWIPLKPETEEWIPFEINLNKQHTYPEIELLINSLTGSDIAKGFVSSLLSEDGRQIYAIEIGKGSKKVVFTAGIHAREVANTQFLLKFASILVDKYEQKDEKIVDILNNYCVVMLPCVNPDGYAAAIEGNKTFYNKELFLALQKNDEIFKAKSNANGIDLNRNFPSYSSCLMWDNIELKRSFTNNSPSINYFAGFKLGSENETMVVMNFLMRNIPFAYRYIDLHSAGRLIYAGKPHLSDEFNNLCNYTGKIISNHTTYSLYGLNHEDSGRGTDGTITDFAAEIAAGFVFNDKLGRLAPPETDSLVRKVENLQYRCSVNTIETLKTSKKEGYGLLRTSTPEMHVNEWNKYKFEKLFLKLITE